MTYEEMLKLLSIFKSMGVDKMRITGGEPFARKDILYFLKKVKNEIRPSSFSITSNATVLDEYLDELPALFESMNISLDSLDRQRFFEITRKDVFPKVIDNINAILNTGIDVKINAVIMSDKNIQDIVPMVQWTREKNMDVRFIEEMPFNGTRGSDKISTWNYKDILSHIKTNIGSYETLPNPPSSTSMMYRIPGYVGRFGIIPAFSRTFCGSCNRLRLTPKGEMRTCLYSTQGTDLLTPLREGVSDDALRQIITAAVMNKEKDGYEAAKKRSFIPIYESMTTIGG